MVTVAPHVSLPTQGRTWRAPTRSSAEEELQTRATDVARASGFAHVPPVVFRRGLGGDWMPKERIVRIGRKEIEAPERLWGVLAHELAHAQATGREGHSLRFWRRLAAGLARAGRLDLLRFELGYREGALKIAREYGLSGLPEVRPFSFEVGQRLRAPDGVAWRVRQRFRRGGQPVYRLHARRWVWTVSEDFLVERLTPL